MKKLLLLLAVCCMVSACNTIHGMGQDIEKGGQSIKKSTQ